MVYKRMYGTLFIESWIGISPYNANIIPNTKIRLGICCIVVPFFPTAKSNAIEKYIEILQLG
jgi:hypothetical protein